VVYIIAWRGLACVAYPCLGARRRPDVRDGREVSDSAAQTANDVLRVAMLLFLNYVDAATTMAETAGGGGGVESGWGRGKDDDDEWWARRCARKAAWLCKPMRRTFKR